MKEKILEYLKDKPFGARPTQIGMALGKKYVNASSSVNQPLKQLIKQGKVTRSSDGSGGVYYKLA